MCVGTKQGNNTICVSVVTVQQHCLYKNVQVSGSLWVVRNLSNCCKFTGVPNVCSITQSPLRGDLLTSAADSDPAMALKFIPLIYKNKTQPRMLSLNPRELIISCDNNRSLFSSLHFFSLLFFFP